MTFVMEVYFFTTRPEQVSRLRAEMDDSLHKLDEPTTSVAPQTSKSKKRVNRTAKCGDEVITRERRPQRASALRASEKINEIMSKKKRVQRQSEEYEVEDILSHTVRNGQTIYSISWVGYPGYISEMTEEDLVNCGELLKEYKLKMKEGPKRPVKVSTHSISTWNRASYMGGGRVIS
ncbi:hypothetical protein OSTOST_06174 [Ostertagia ostertagi]